MGRSNTLMAFLVHALLTVGAIASPPQARSISEWLSLQQESSHPALIAWSQSVGFAVRPMDPFTLPRVTSECFPQGLFPVSPYQDTKDYEAAQFARFNHVKIAPRDSLCLTRNFPGTKCLAADFVQARLMSDFFVDRCGRFFKGYWSVVFQKSHESMGTLLSKGRTVYPKLGSPYEAVETEEGDTYPVAPQEFEFFTEPTPQEIERARASRAHALRYGFALDDQGLLFTKQK